MARNVSDELREIAERVVVMAKKAGADDAEVQVSDGTELTAKVRLGEPELVQEAGSRGLGLRVFRDLRQAVTYTSDLRDHSLERFAADTVALARLSEPDELHRLPDATELARSFPELDLYDVDSEPLEAAEALARAVRGEKAALAFDTRVTNSEGATYSRVLGAMALATSGGFSGSYRGSYSSLTVEPVCDDEGGKKRNGYWWTGSRFVAALDGQGEPGRRALIRVVAQPEAGEHARLEIAGRDGDLACADRLDQLAVGLDAGGGRIGVARLDVEALGGDARRQALGHPGQRGAEVERVGGGIVGADGLPVAGGAERVDHPLHA